MARKYTLQMLKCIIHMCTKSPEGTDSRTCTKIRKASWSSGRFTEARWEFVPDAPRSRTTLNRGTTQEFSKALAPSSRIFDCLLHQYLSIFQRILERTTMESTALAPSTMRSRLPTAYVSRALMCSVDICKKLYAIVVSPGGTASFKGPTNSCGQRLCFCLIRRPRPSEKFVLHRQLACLH